MDIHKLIHTIWNVTYHTKRRLGFSYRILRNALRPGWVYCSKAHSHCLHTAGHHGWDVPGCLSCRNGFKLLHQGNHSTSHKTLISICTTELLWRPQTLLWDTSLWIWVQVASQMTTLFPYIVHYFWAGQCFPAPVASTAHTCICRPGQTHLTQLVN